jgi:YD repeat-containing protein
LVSTVQYANKVSTGSWLSGSTVTVALFANIGVVADTSKDRVQLMTYDLAGKLVSQSDGALSNAERSITNYTYDGANRLIQVDITDSLATVATKRTSRTLYDAAGRVAATVDAELYVVENVYDGSGLLTSSIRYATKTANATATTLGSLRPTLNANDDQTTRYYYNGRGQLIGTLDAQGYLTEFVIDEQGNARSERRYANAITWISTDTLTTLKSKAGVYLESRMAYNGLGQLLTKTNTEGTVTRYNYDEAGRLVRTETAADTSEVRDGFVRYNVFNEIIGEMSGVQAETARLTLLAGKYLNDATLSESQLNTAYAQFGVTHSYNALGLREESIDAQGNKTWYFYDANGRQTFLARGTAQDNTGATGALNGYAEITETRYDAFGGILDSIAYTGKVQIPVPGSRVSLAGVISTLIFSAATDSKRSYAYTSRGLLASLTGAEGALTTYS